MKRIVGIGALLCLIVTQSGCAIPKPQFNKAYLPQATMSHG